MWIILFIFWIILNGKVNLEVVILGAIMSSVVYYFLFKFMDLSLKKEKIISKSIWGIEKYLIFLFFEVIKANFATAKIILNFEEEPEPVLVKFESDLKSGTANTALANSITLTPGTITIDVDGENNFVVHALDKSFAVGIESCDFVEKIAVLEDKAFNNNAE